MEKEKVYDVSFNYPGHNKQALITVIGNERIEDAIKVYDDWIIELNEADGDSVTDLIFNMVELLNEYKRFNSYFTNIKYYLLGYISSNGIKIYK